MLCAVIAFACICALVVACAPVVPSNENNEMVKKVVCFMTSLFFIPFNVSYYSTKNLLLKMIMCFLLSVL